MASFDVERLIGTGAFSETYLVKSKTSGGRYVLKKMTIASKDQLERAIKEVQILKALHHPNIVNYQNGYVASVEKGTIERVFIEMEYCEKGDLAKVINGQNGVRFSQDRVLSWFAQLCSAIQYIHDKGIMHRDLKSQNIFLKSDDTPKIGNFGLATVLENTFAKAETMCGTIGYLAPEILKSKPYGKKCDIWSLGCVLFEMITLQPPFPQQIFELVHNIVQMAATPVPSNCHESLQQIVGMMLKYEPSERASIRDVIEHLEKSWSAQALGAGRKSQSDVWPAADCNACGCQVMGISYKCLECRDFYLCMTCEKQGSHSEHPMLRTCGDVQQNWLHIGIPCAGCHEKPIQGARYRCLSCPDFDLCWRCYSTNRHPEHGFAFVCKPPRPVSYC